MEENNRKIVIVNQSAGDLEVDVINAYIDGGYTVSLICGYLSLGIRPLKQDIDISYVKRYNRKTKFTRIYTWLVAAIQIYLKIKFKYKDYSVLFYTNPPTNIFVTRLIKNHYSIQIYDIYPDALKNIGIKENNFIYKRWTKINKKSFAKADTVFTISEGMKETLKQYVSANKIKVVPLWSSIEVKPIKKEDNPFIHNNKLDGKFVIMYSGNIGYTHNVETIIDIASTLQNEKDIQFVIIGNGGKKTMLQQRVKAENINNCMFLDFQPIEKMNESLGSADLSIITLTEETALVSVPSKAFNVLSCGTPVLGIAPEISEINHLLTKNNCGQCFQKDNLQGMIEYILMLKNNKSVWEEYSKNALNTSKLFTYKNAEMFIK